MSLILAAIIGVVSPPPENNIPPQILPAQVCDTTYMEITKDTELNLNLAVITPNGHFSILAHDGGSSLIPYYWTNHEISYRADDLYSINYVEGIPTLRKVFQELGTYEFIFSDSQYAEPENAIRITRTVTFVSRDHPNCP